MRLLSALLLTSFLAAALATGQPTSAPAGATLMPDMESPGSSPAPLV